MTGCKPEGFRAQAVFHPPLPSLPWLAHPASLCSSPYLIPVSSVTLGLRRLFSLSWVCGRTWGRRQTCDPLAVVVGTVLPCLSLYQVPQPLPQVPTVFVPLLGVDRDVPARFHMSHILGTCGTAWLAGAQRNKTSSIVSFK